MYEHKRRLYKIDKVIIVCEGIKANWFALVFADSSEPSVDSGCEQPSYTQCTLLVYFCADQASLTYHKSTQIMQYHSRGHNDLSMQI